MAESLAPRQDLSAEELAREALWFVAHTAAAVSILILTILALSLTHPRADVDGPKIIATALALLAPMVGGWIIGKVLPNPIARSVWISGLLTFAVVCVWVLDLPTGPGLCEQCGALEKLSRTFFSLHHGSGLMNGDGLLVGVWTPLSMIGYALGARMAVLPDGSSARGAIPS